MLTHNESMPQKTDEVKQTIKFQMKKVCVLQNNYTCLAVDQVDIDNTTVPLDNAFICWAFFFPFLGSVSSCCYWKCDNDPRSVAVKYNAFGELSGVFVEEELAERQSFVHQKFDGTISENLLN